MTNQIILIETSNRHCHLSATDLAVLFGADYQLKVKKVLSQADNFAAEETLTLKTEQGVLEKVRVIGPTRMQTQMEISASDAELLGLKPPVRLSGDLAGSTGATLIGPVGQVELKEGVIIAQRHLHCDEVSATELNLRSGQIISVAIDEPNFYMFKEVIVRVQTGASLALHIDVDEAKEAGLVRGQEVFGYVLETADNTD